MKYRIELSKKAEKSLEKIDKRFKTRIERVIDSLSIDPLIGKPLEGEYLGLRSCRVWPYRIIYQVYRYQLLILVINIRHRQSAYKD